MYDIGSILAIHKNFYRHVAVYVGNNLVLQNTPARGEEIVTVQQFANGGPFTVRDPQRFDAQHLLNRANAIAVNPKSYDWISNNCEHTVSKALYGKSSSPQIFVAAMIATFFILVVVAQESK